MAIFLFAAICTNALLWCYRKKAKLLPVSKLPKQGEEFRRLVHYLAMLAIVIMLISIVFCSNDFVNTYCWIAGSLVMLVAWHVSYKMVVVINNGEQQ